MLTFIKQIFTWWNQQTLGTRIHTLFFGKFVGKDSFGNRYYKSRSGRRWVIYKDENGNILCIAAKSCSTVYPQYNSGGIHPHYIYVFCFA